MALINCPECKKEISDTAKKCPNCGYKIPTKTKRNVIIIFSIIFIIIVIISSIVLYVHSQPIYQYKHQIIETLNDYKNDTISYEKAYKKINSIETKVNTAYEKEENSSKRMKLLGLNITISGINLELIKSNTYGYDNTKLDEYISELKR